MNNLRGKWAFVTGSSRGIGQQIALALAKVGCNVIVHGRKKENTSKTLELLKEYPVKTDVVFGELTSREDVNRIIREINEKYPIDILYNNAGIQNQGMNMFDIPYEDWLRVFEINVFSLASFCNGFIPGMKKRGFGRVINLSSGIENVPDLTPYAASKAAVDKYTKDLAFELKGTNVLVNCVDPGWIRTDLGGEYAPNDVTSVLPGALVPALLDEDGPSGECFLAQDYNK